MTSEQPSFPHGELLLQTVAMPEHTNPNHDIFGGWIMSQMDLAGGILAAEIAQGRIVTVAVKEIQFIQPVRIGDIVSCYGRCVRVGNTSLHLGIEVWVKRFTPNNPTPTYQLVTQSIFSYVAIDENGNTRPIPKENNPKLIAVG